MEKQLKDSEKELVSIITPLYNSEKYIGATIRSVLAQTYKNWEMIIVDDCSEDDGVEVARSYRDSRIKIYSLKENSGGSAARNYAIERAGGRYIAFLDSDDLWKEEKLGKQVEFMKRKDAEFSYTWYSKIDESGRYTGRVGSIPGNLDYKRLLRANYIGCLTGVYDTKRIGKVYLPVIKRRQDYALWLEVIKKTGTAMCLEEDLALYRVRSNSLSQSKVKRLYYNYLVYYQVEKFGAIKSFIYLLGNAFIKTGFKYKEVRGKVKKSKIKEKFLLQ